MKIGFTGTRLGMTEQQKEVIYRLLLDFLSSPGNNNNEVHHGDCIGADAEFHDLAESLKYKIVIHPPNISKLRAFKKSNIIEKEKPYLERNKDIVKNSNVLIAATKGFIEESRSGTWSTIRFAREYLTHDSTIIVFPNGQIKWS